MDVLGLPYSVNIFVDIKSQNHLLQARSSCSEYLYGANCCWKHFQASVDVLCSRQANFVSCGYLRRTGSDPG